MSDAAVRERCGMVESLPSSLSSIPAAVGLKFCADARHTGSLVTWFLVQTPVGAADMTLVEITNHLFPSGEKGGGQFNSLTKSLLLLKRERTLKAYVSHSLSQLRTLLSGILLCKSQRQ